VGRPYREVFSSRLRRYLGGVLRRLEIDFVYWEDAVTWGDLRRVFVVLFESHDQDRVPLRERAFVGLPRVEVLVQDPGAERPRRAATPADGTPPALRARVLVVRRRRGGEEVEAPLPPDRRRTPVPV
jgi:hypothetical protein